MAVSMIYGILQIISFKQWTMCGSWVYSCRFTKYVFFPTEVKGLKELTHGTRNYLELKDNRK